MSVRGAGLALLLCFAGGGAASWAQPPGSIPPVYTERLRVPVRGDDLAQPRAVVADHHSGEVLVCDTLRNRIVIFDPQGRFRYEIPGGSAFQSPVDLAVDRQGYLFVLSQVSSEIALLDFDGRLIRKLPLAGLPEEAARPRFVSLAIAPAGDRLYLMDAENHRLWITDRDVVVQDSVDLTVDRPAKQIDELRYGHVDVYGDTVLLPIPTDGLVHLFDLAGRPRATLGAPGSAACQTMFPAAAALDDQGRVIILDRQRALFMTWDLARGVCLSEHYGFGNAPGAFYQPNDLALDRAGRLYVSQGFEGRVQVYEGARPAAAQLAARRASPEETVEVTLGGAAAAGPVEASDASSTGERAPAAAAAGAAAIAERAPETDPLAAIEETVRAWARAWSEKRIDDYLAFYSDAFDSGRELSRAEWQALRRVRLDRPRSIEVSLARLEVRLTDADRARAAFTQSYRSDLYADKVDKLLVLRREADDWKILAERVVKTYRE